MKSVYLFNYILVNLIFWAFKSSGKQVNTCLTISVLFDDCDCYESVRELKCEEKNPETIKSLNENIRLNTKQTNETITIKINNKKVPHLEIK